MHLAITTAPGLESFVKNECSRMKIKVTKVEDRLVQVESTDDAMAKLNIGLRTANRVYLKLNEGKSTSFDDLFELVKSINWRSLVPKNAPIIVDALSIKSTLESIPAVQRTV
ncbi:MAG: class I SAM-dependent RNA methyltransferase, partial [Patescibacteria group bacterium]